MNTSTNSRAKLLFHESNASYIQSNPNRIRDSGAFCLLVEKLSGWVSFANKKEEVLLPNYSPFETNLSIVLVAVVEMIIILATHVFVLYNFSGKFVRQCVHTYIHI